MKFKELELLFKQRNLLSLQTIGVFIGSSKDIKYNTYECFCFGLCIDLTVANIFPNKETTFQSFLFPVSTATIIILLGFSPELLQYPSGWCYSALCTISIHQCFVGCFCCTCTNQNSSKPFPHTREQNKKFCYGEFQTFKKVD